MALENVFLRNTFASRAGRLSKEEGALQKAIQAGHLPPGSTIEDFRAYMKRLQEQREQETQDKYGLSLEEWRKREQAKGQAIQDREAMHKADLQQQLAAKGIQYPQGASASELLLLLKGGALPDTTNLDSTTANLDSPDADPNGDGQRSWAYRNRKAILGSASLLVLVLLFIGIRAYQNSNKQTEDND